MVLPRTTFWIEGPLIAPLLQCAVNITPSGAALNLKGSEDQFLMLFYYD